MDLSIVVTNGATENPARVPAPKPIKIRLVILKSCSVSGGECWNVLFTFEAIVWVADACISRGFCFMSLNYDKLLTFTLES